jgi:hypothetical protein
MNDKTFNIDFLNKWSDESLSKIFLNDLDQTIFRHPVKKPAEILMTGCSFTEGLTIETKYIWPTHIEQMTGKECVNLGKSGASFVGSISRIFAHIREYGNPNIILALLPDPFRLYLPSIYGRFIIDKINHLEFSQMGLTPEKPLLKDSGFWIWNTRNRSYAQPKYSKAPHQMTDIIPAEVAFHLSIQYLHLLEQYCQATGIKLVWGTWNETTKEFIYKMKSISNESYLNNFIDFQEDYVYSKDGMCFDCHKDLEEQDKVTFIKSEDKQHWGSHSHIHAAERFYKHIKDYL